jgi:glycosyltransferase involved in cell wall biosynthesis
MEIMVSIICNTYNQESYLRQTLDSFINQKTNFNFEVIIHDDASTDSTAEIIREYQSRYPEIIVPIIEEENQYQKDVNITLDIDFPLAKGKYFAFCEGDDFWIDPLKLQKQVDYMENNPLCTMCIHSSIKVNKKGKNLGQYNTFKKNGIISIDKVILSGGEFCATNSILAPTRLVSDVPLYLKNYCIDYFWQLYLAGEGYVYAFADVMSAYRINSVGSWTSRMRKDNCFFSQHLEAMYNNLLEYDQDTDYRYHEYVKQRITGNRYSYYVLKKQYDELKKEPLKDYVWKLNRKEKIKLVLKINVPYIFSIISKLRELIFE